MQFNPYILVHVLRQNVAYLAHEAYSSGLLFRPIV